jgi:NADH-quinone oxidoreductase subunit L
MIGFAGFYSKDLIIHHAGSFSYLATHSGKSGAYWWFFILPTVIAYVTAFYMTRCWMLTFWGRPRNQHLYDHAHETPVMYIPLIVLAVLSVIGGSMLGVKDMLENSVKETNNYFLAGTPPRDATFGGFQTAWAPKGAYEGAADAVGHAYHEGHHLLKYVAFAFVVGIGLGVLVYWNGFKVANAVLRFPLLRWVNIWLYRRMYFDELYMGIFVAITMGISKLAGIFDKYVVDGLVPGERGRQTGEKGLGRRGPQRPVCGGRQRERRGDGGTEPGRGGARPADGADSGLRFGADGGGGAGTGGRHRDCAL